MDELTLVCMAVHGLHSVWVALNTTGWMWTSSPWFVCLFIDYIQCEVALNTTGWMWTSSPWFVCLFMDYIQCGWLSIQLGGCGQAHLGLNACSSTTFSMGGSQNTAGCTAKTSWLF